MRCGSGTRVNTCCMHTPGVRCRQTDANVVAFDAALYSKLLFFW